jgi:hypothetical protein
MAKRGRPTTYTPELGALICDLMAEGQTLRTICADEAMPKVSTIGQWRAAHPEFASLYAHARELAGEAEADLAKAYSEMTHVLLPNGMYVPVDVQRSRLMADTAKWRAAKLFPKDYGDKLALEHSGSITFNDMADEDIVERMRELIASGRVALPDGWELVEDDDEEDHSDLA